VTNLRHWISIVENLENISVSDIHDLADRKGVKWNNDPNFLAQTKKLTGKAHLDDLNPSQLKTVRDWLMTQGSDGEEKKLDKILSRLCKMILKNLPKKSKGMVAACVLDPNNNRVSGISRYENGKWHHAERVAMEKYIKKFGDIPKDSIIITTCSPCSEHMPDRYAESCSDLINKSPVRKVYCGIEDSTQPSKNKKFDLTVTSNKNIRRLCEKFLETFTDQEENLEENFADGKITGKSRPGRVKKAGASCKGSPTDLRAKAKKYGGEKGKMYHWCANMKGGKK